MLITKIFSSGITEGYHLDRLKEILDNTILKDNYFLSRESFRLYGYIPKKHFENRKPFEFPDFQNNKYYFSDLAQVLIETFGLTFLHIEIFFEENNIKWKQEIEFLDYCLELKHGLLLYEGYFCPHCLIDVDLEQLLDESICPICNNKASECNISEYRTFPGYLYGPEVEVFYRCKNNTHNYFYRTEHLIYDVMTKNPEKIITCPICGHEYKAKDIIYGVKDSGETIKKYPEPTYE